MEEQLVIAYIYSRGGWLLRLTDLVLSTVNRGLARACACKGSWTSCRGGVLVRAPRGAAEGVRLQGLSEELQRRFSCEGS